ncbi:hypothetical protein SEA_BANTAM_53 [Gordonia phage Bantam]|uniref:Phage protein n=1 Tax=Gordonia phage Bantam TaxID=1887641 RepID=A0A1B3AYB9_9CAUD|nr:hypothetical protein BIZ77_gp125 [Gordonia phage Bantam]AOE43743.1 hypothetical protein SEA_BANTAM_53 [Gordonia phage Bantam]
MTAPKKYRKKPVEIEALVFDGTNAQQIAEWTGQWRPGDIKWGTDSDFFVIETLEGAMYANVGDYIIRGVQGEFYPCKPHIFAATYEEV